MKEYFLFREEITEIKLKIFNDDFESRYHIGEFDSQVFLYHSPYFEDGVAWKKFLREKNFAEILTTMHYFLACLKQGIAEPFFGKDLYNDFQKAKQDIENIVSRWFIDLEASVFTILDLYSEEIKQGTRFPSGEYESILFKDGTEIKILDENNGFVSGCYVDENDYALLLKDILRLREIVSGEEKLSEDKKLSIIKDNLPL